MRRWPQGEGTSTGLGAHAIRPSRLYERLFTQENPDDMPRSGFPGVSESHSLETLPGCMVEPSLKGCAAGASTSSSAGLFCVDPTLRTQLVFNRASHSRTSGPRSRSQRTK